MKLMIASDIHGSALWCEKMLDAFVREQCGKLLLLGDILYHGPRNPLPEGHDPKAVASMLNSVKEKLLCVRGNCDCEVDQMVLEFPVLADYIWLFEGGLEMFATHGHVYNKQNPPPMPKGSVLLNGHFHIPELTQCDGFTYVNCGSVALPKQGSAHSYVICDGGSFLFRAL